MNEEDYGIERCLESAVRVKVAVMLGEMRVVAPSVQVEKVV